MLPLPRKQSPSQYISIFLVSETYLPIETTLLCHLAAEFFFCAEGRSGICRKLLKVTEYCPSDDSMNLRRNLHLQSLTTQVLCGKIQRYAAQDPQQKLSWHICLFPESRHSPQCRMSSRAGYTVAHGGRQVAPSVQVLDGPTPGLWFVHWALHSAFHTFKVKTKTKEKCH